MYSEGPVNMFRIEKPRSGRERKEGGQFDCKVRLPKSETAQETRNRFKSLITLTVRGGTYDFLQAGIGLLFIRSELFLTHNEWRWESKLILLREPPLGQRDK